MDKERILELARQERVLIPGLIGFQDSLVEFARELLRIVRADEREACARLENEIKQMEIIPEQEPVAKVAVRPFNPMDASYPTVEVKWLKEPVSGVLYAAPQPVSQEPVSNDWKYNPETGEPLIDGRPLWSGLPQPVRTKDLTDDEIDEIFAEHGTIPNTKAVRSVIAADREKNK